AVVTGMPDPHSVIAGTYFTSYAGRLVPANVNVAVSLHGPLADATPVRVACASAVAVAVPVNTAGKGGPAGGVAHAADVAVGGATVAATTVGDAVGGVVLSLESSP